MIRGIQCLSIVILIVLVSLALQKEVSAERAYIANSGGKSVTVLDTATNTIIATIPVGFYPLGVAVNSAGTRVFVTNMSDGTVSVINTATNTVIATITIPIQRSNFVHVLNGVDVNPSGTRVYVANASGEGTLSVIDIASNTIIATIGVTAPFGVAVNPTGSRVYVANSDMGTVSVIDTATNTFIKYVYVGQRPYGVAMNPAGTRLYVTNTGSSTVSVIDTATDIVIATVPVGDGPWSVAVNPAGTYAYVANPLSNTVSVIDTSTNTVSATVIAGNYPSGVSVNMSGTRLYVTNPYNDTVSVVDTATNTLTTTINVGHGPFSLGQFIGVQGGSVSTLITVASSMNPSTFGSSVTFTATVSGAGPTGTVTFKDGETVLGTGTLSGGIATHGTASLSVGTHSITAVYSGNTNNAPSTSSTLTQTVTPDVVTSASKSKISSPPDGFTLMSTSQKFVWNQTKASEYRLAIGSSQGAEDIYSQSQGTSNSVTVDNLPSNGITLYVRLSSKVNGTWEYNDYTYKAFTDTTKGGNGNKGNTENKGNATTGCKTGILYNASFLGGSSGSVCLSVNKVSTPSGDSKLRGTASWKGFATTADSADGSTFTFAWENYESDPNSGMLYENDPAHGALFILAYAFSSSACSGGASFFAVIEMPNAVSMADFGSSITFTPLFGQICGTKITSLNSYALTR